MHFSWFLKFWPLKISKIMKISKFQMLLDQPILKIFQYLKVRMKAEVLQFKNWETKFFSKRLQNQILKKKFFKKITTRKNENFDFSIFPQISIKKLFLQLLTQKNQFFGWFCAFFVLENFFIRLLVFSIRALENLDFSWFFTFRPLKS